MVGAGSAIPEGMVGGYRGDVVLEVIDYSVVVVIPGDEELEAEGAGAEGHVEEMGFGRIVDKEALT